MKLTLPSELTLPHAAELREHLLPALDAGEPVELDDAAVEQVDAAGLQVLCALHRSARERGFGLRFKGGARGAALERAAASAGFLRHQGCTPDCLWKEAR